ncbi:MAG: glutamate racemase [Deltaproteobacteria bacterium]|nr:glutamate racemase [Deltaproteobacteria bacterium]
MADTPFIGVFDSGVGGLTVLRAIRTALPHEPVAYLGDTARVPYGNKSAETVARYALESARFLHGRGAKLLVVACNTSTAFALSTLAQQIPIPVIGVIDPGARMAVAASRSRRIGVIATAGTIASRAYERAILALAPHVHVVSQACPLFVPLVEEGWAGTDVAQLVIARYLDPLGAARVDTVILGCTHYPLLAAGIQAGLGSAVRLIDSGPAVAEQVRAVLAERRSLAPSDRPASLRLFVTDNSPVFAAMVARLFGADGIAMPPHVVTLA